MANLDKAYLVKHAAEKPELKGYWDGPVWRRVETVEIDQFHPKSSGHRPRARAKMLYDQEGLYLIYRVEDRYVRSIHTRFNEMVALYTCVEFFVKPKDTGGFFNFEFNCGGTLLCFYTYEWREEGGSNKYHALTDEQCGQVKVYHSMPQVVDPEIDEPAGVGSRILHPLRPAGAVHRPSGRCRRTGVARQLLQMFPRRRRASALGGLGSGGDLELPPTALFWLVEL